MKKYFIKPVFEDQSIEVALNADQDGIWITLNGLRGTYLIDRTRDGSYRVAQNISEVLQNNMDIS